ncbi:uncharacterized protein E0L32_001885 [Thyridium curvatum]|uniref:Uncharacterized protein n=1 Tax=Thyridium curvatum TaxID=1093900 RepID=A0A507AVN8_9PEZI|nr:uncharacterized protein E0L32_001794 [Thyridium curvatum]XP_030990021.1 uncharacterized protein E0L32_001885 [Thyridium curvatum]TPX08219.1 hypothetical protein E0L32_001794 [Thyridium curvatum]TPX08310.1 hypothetical protein E0L32_001885 [Thyridium curvatum]
MNATDTAQLPSSSTAQISATPSSHPRRPPSSVNSARLQPPAAQQHPPHKDARRSLPLPFPPIFFAPNNASSTSLVSSTAEGRPIPLDDSTTANRTSALRELNSHYPSPVLRHRYSKSSGPQSSTYSQPVIVRTYSGPSPSQHPYAKSHSGQYRSHIPGRSALRKPPGVVASSTAAALSTSTPTPGCLEPRVVIANGWSVNMARNKPKKKSAWSWLSRRDSDEQDEARLPPLEAYSFKGFMANLQAQDSDIDADLDRIAEICARSRYSLSNQYEVHMKPHGSGSSFAGAGARGARSETASSSSGRRHRNSSKHQGALTLQAVQSDDETSRAHRKRRSGGRRRSIAYGTLETIMSSSRSSEEDKSKKRSAQEIAEEVRGRAALKKAESVRDRSHSGSGSGSTDEGLTSGPKSTAQAPKPTRKKSTSFAHAVIDSTRQLGTTHHPTTPRGSAAALVSEPALPQTSSSHLEIRTGPAISQTVDQTSAPRPRPANMDRVEESQLPYSRPSVLPSEETGISATALLTSLSSWVPWKSNGDLSGTGNPSHAEGSLRSLLKSAEEHQTQGTDQDRP